VSKVLHIALREFIATVATKGFIIGVLVTPALIGMLIVVMPRLLNNKPPRVEGHVAILDHSGEVAGTLRDYLAPEAMAERRRADTERAIARAPQAVQDLANAPGAGAKAREALDQALGEVPRIDVVELPQGAALDKEKDALKTTMQDGARLALLVVARDAVARDADSGEFGGYEMFVRAKLDDRLEDEIRNGLRDAIIEARVRHAGLDRERIEALTHVRRPTSVTVTDQGERKTNEVFNVLLPAGFMILLLISVLTGGQYLMTTTIEEKSSRVVEVLLSAVSPMQLMTGKIIGEMCVGFVILALYAGMGLTALVSFAMVGLLDPKLLLYLVLFYLIAYFIIGALMAAIGSAVNEMREAQTLMTPVMLCLMIPWMLWMPITRDPNSVFSTVISFVPPINTFAMLLRMTSTAPPPAWQVWLSILIGLASVYGALWFAAKVFRVGLLMYGKPPNFATLVRWVRMA